MSEAIVDRLEVHVEATSEEARKGLDTLMHTLGRLQKLLNGDMGFSRYESQIRKVINVNTEAEKSVSSLNKALEKIRENQKKAMPENLSKKLETLGQLPESLSNAPLQSVENSFSRSFDQAQNIKDTVSAIGVAMEKASSNIGVPAKFGVQLLEMNQQMNSLLEKQARLGDTDYSRMVSQFQENMQKAFGMGRGLNQGIVDCLRDAMRRLADYAPVAQQAAEASKVVKLSVDDMARSFENFRNVVKRAFSGADKLRSMFSRILMYRGIRSMILGLTNSFREGWSNLKTYAETMDNGFHRAMVSSQGALAQLKNSVAAAASPIVTALVPAFLTLTSAVISAVNAINQFLALIFGASSWTMAKDVSSGLDDIGKAAGGAGKQLKGLLAGWDELNIIQSQSAGGGGGGAASDLSKLFEEREFDPELLKFLDWTKEHLDLITSAALGVGAAFLTWGISKGLGLGLQDTLKWTLAVGLVVFGVSEIYQGLTDQINNGIDWKNLQMMLLGVGVVAAGLGLAFGAVGVGWGLLAGGITLAISPLKELIEQGKLSDEAMTQLSASILSVGAGISLLTGSWIPLALAGIAVTVGWIVQKWDAIQNLDWKIIPQYIRENVAEIKGIMTDVSFAGIAVGALLAFSGVNPALGIGLIAAGAVGVAITQLDWSAMSNDVDKALQQILQVVSAGTFAVGAILALSGASVPLGIGMMIAGAAGAVGASIDWGGLLGSIQQSWDEITAWAQVLSVGSVALGAVLALSGVSVLPGLGMIAAGVAGIVATTDTASLLGQLEKAWEDITKWAIPLSAGSFALGLVLALTGVAVIPGLGMMAAGVGTMFATDSWGSLLDTLKQGWNEIVVWAKGLLSDVIDFGAKLANFFIQPINQVIGEINNALEPFGISIPTLTTVSAEEWKREWGLIEDTVSESVDFINQELGAIIIDGKTPLRLYDTLYEAINYYDESMIDSFTPGDYYNQVIRPFVDEMLSSKQIVGDAAAEIGSMFYDKWVQSLFDEEWEGTTNGLINILEEAMEFSPDFDSSLRGLQKTLIETVAENAGVDMSDVLSFWEVNSGDIHNYEQLTQMYQEVFNAISEYGTEWQEFVGLSDEKPDFSIETPDYSGPEGAMEGFSSSVGKMASSVSANVQSVFRSLSALQNVKLGFSAAVNFSLPRIVQPPAVRFAADGGMFDHGELFVAREAGAEMVGTIGHKTAVANNDQIVEGVASGVAAGQREQTRALSKIEERLRRIEQKEFTATVVPSSALGRVNRISAEMYSKQTGVY